MATESTVPSGTSIEGRAFSALTGKWSEAATNITWAKGQLESLVSTFNKALPSSSLKTELENLKNGLDQLADFSYSGAANYTEPTSKPTKTITAYTAPAAPAYKDYADSVVDTSKISLPADVTPVNFPEKSTLPDVNNYEKPTLPTADAMKSVADFILPDKPIAPEFITVKDFVEPTPAPAVDPLVDYGTSIADLKSPELDLLAITPWSAPLTEVPATVELSEYETYIKPVFEAAPAISGIAPYEPSVIPGISTLTIPDSIDHVLPDKPVFNETPELVATLLDIPAPLQAIMPTDPTIDAFSDTSDASTKLAAVHDLFVAEIAKVLEEAGFVTISTISKINNITFRTITDIQYPEMSAMGSIVGATPREVDYGVSQEQIDVINLLLERESLVNDALVAKLSTQLATTLSVLSSQYSSRGFDLPPGSLLAQQQEATTTVGYLYNDAVAAIGREIIGASTQVLTGAMQADAQIKGANTQASAQMAQAILQADNQVAIESAKQITEREIASLSSKTQISVENAKNEILAATEQIKSDSQIAIENAKNEVTIASGKIDSETAITTANLQAKSQLMQSRLQSVSQAISPWVQAYTAYFDRGLKYVMEKATMSIETFKAKVQAQLTLIEANKIYIEATASHNVAVLSTSTEKIRFVDTTNKSFALQYELGMDQIMILMKEELLGIETQAKINTVKADAYGYETKMIAEKDHLKVAQIGNEVALKGEEVKVFGMKSDLTKQEGDIMFAKIKMTLQENEARVREFASIVDAYAAEVKGKADIMTAQSSAVKGQVSAFIARIEGLAARVSGISQMNTALISKYSAQVGSYQGQTEAQVKQMLSQISVNDALSKLFRVETDWVDAQGKERLGRIMLQIDENKNLLEKYKTELGFGTADSDAQVKIIDAQSHVKKLVRDIDAIEAQYAETKNKGMYSSYIAAVQAVIEQYKNRNALIQNENEIIKGQATINQGLIAQFEQESKGSLSTQQGDMQVLQGEIATWDGLVKGAVASTQANVEIEKLKFAVNELNMKKKQLVNELVQMAARIDIEYASKELTAEIEGLRANSSSVSQIIAAAMNAVSVSTSYGFDGSQSDSLDLTAMNGYISKSEVTQKKG